MGSDLAERRIGAVTVLFGERGGKYPHGNSLSVRGSEECLVIDPSLGLLPRRDALPPADFVLNSHCHEDHVAGNHLFPDVPWHFHEADAPCIRSIDAFMDVYGFPEPIAGSFRKLLVERFHVVTRADPRIFRDGEVFDLGGGVRVRVIHAPGHTRGHCFFHVEPDDLLYLADVDLSSFGPYYGDAWSCLADFERTLESTRKLQARHYATFHHIGVLDDRETFLARLDRFATVIRSREARLLDFLGEPRSLDEIVAHRSSTGQPTMCSSPIRSSDAACRSISSACSRRGAFSRTLPVATARDPPPDPGEERLQQLASDRAAAPGRSRRRPVPAPTSGRPAGTRGRQGRRSSCASTRS